MTRADTTQWVKLTTPERATVGQRRALHRWGINPKLVAVMTKDEASRQLQLLDALNKTPRPPAEDPDW